MAKNNSNTKRDSPDLRRGKFMINFPRSISEFEKAMHKFPVKNILYRTIFRGKGLEFDSYRVFAPDDDAVLIDWKATLRANQILARKYIEERDLNVYFLVDVSSSMLFGSSKKLKAEYVAEFAAALGHLVVGAGDRIGLIMFSDSVVKVLPPSSSKNQFGLFTKFLSDESFYGGGFNLDSAIEYSLRMTKSPYSVFILISDFIKVKKTDLRNLRVLGSKFETLAVMVRDELDNNLPRTTYQFSIQDPYSGRQMILDPTIASERYHKNVLRQKSALKEMFRRSKIDFVELMTNKGFAIPLIIFLKGRSKGERI